MKMGRWSGRAWGRWPGRSKGRRSGRIRTWRGNRLVRFVRGARPDRNPLRRTSDRVETWVLAGSLLAAVAATPFAARMAADVTHDAAVRTQRAQEASELRVRAVLLRPAGRTQAVMDTGVPTQARWTSVTGAPRHGEVLATPGAPRGAEVVVWTDATGNLTRSPLTDSQVAGQADLAESGAIAGIVLLLAGEVLLVRHILYRRRMAAWGDQWGVTGPAWNRQRW